MGFLIAPILKKSCNSLPPFLLDVHNNGRTCDLKKHSTFQRHTSSGNIAMVVCVYLPTFCVFHKVVSVSGLLRVVCKMRDHVAAYGQRRNG